MRLRQVLNNIVGNAIKFTNQGCVELKVAFSNPTLKFIVSDTGIGISKTQESKLFQSFSQADTSTTRKFGGSGLGLVLSRRLAELLGGRLELLKSEKSGGSTFYAEINTPLLPNAKLIADEALSEIMDELPSVHQEGQLLCGLKVLLVDDSPDNQMLIAMFLSKQSALVTLACNGSQAVDFALSKAFDFDVVLMDIQMPVLDGHEATKKLRAVGFSKPIIALTAHAMAEEREKCFASGFNEFLTKPVQRNLLIEMLARYVVSDGAQVLPSRV